MDETTPLSPLEVMLSVMRERWSANDRDGAAKIAQIAAPYVHARAAQQSPRATSGMSDPDLAKWISDDEEAGHDYRL